MKLAGPYVCYFLFWLQLLTVITWIIIFPWLWVLCMTDVSRLVLCSISYGCIMIVNLSAHLDLTRAFHTARHRFCCLPISLGRIVNAILTVKLLLMGWLSVVQLIRLSIFNKAVVRRAGSWNGCYLFVHDMCSVCALVLICHYRWRLCGVCACLVLTCHYRWRYQLR